MLGEYLLEPMVVLNELSQGSLSCKGEKKENSWHYILRSVAEGKRCFWTFSLVHHLGLKGRLDGHNRERIASRWNVESSQSKSMKYLPKNSLDFAENWTNEKA